MKPKDLAEHALAFLYFNGITILTLILFVAILGIAIIFAGHFYDSNQAYAQIQEDAAHQLCATHSQELYDYDYVGRPARYQVYCHDQSIVQGKLYVYDARYLEEKFISIKEE